MEHEHKHRNREHGDHGAHKHHQEQVEEEKTYLAEKTGHGHEKAMPAGHHEAMTDGHKGHDRHHSHEDHHRMMIADFKKRFWVVLVLAVPIVVLSPMVQHMLGYGITFTGLEWVLFGMSSIVFFYGGWPFLKGTVEELKKAAPGMMTLVGVAISVAYLYSSAVVFGLQGEMFFWELATLILIMLLGHWLEMKSVLGASRALELLVEMMPDEATVIRNGQPQQIRVEEIEAGEIVQVKPGEKIPADGVVTEGESYVNESMLTGESKPVKKEKGKQVIGGSVNENGVLKIEVSAVGEASYLSKVINLVRDAQKSKSNTQRLADKAAFWLTIIALAGGGITLAAWLVAGRPFDFALERMVTVMIISCPHALGLAIPLVVAISTAVSAKNGLLIRNRTAFENSRKITTIIFDKTGTLTQGSHEVARVVPLQRLTPEEVLILATAVEQHSEHHIAKGLLKKAKEKGLQVPEAREFKYQPGVGVKAIVKGKQLEAGGEGLLKQLNLEPPEDEAEGVETKIYVFQEHEMIGFITFADQIRPSSYDAINMLKDHGIKTMLLTGDVETVAKSVSAELGIDHYMAGVLPHEKQDKVKELQAKGEFVAMTGDGVNDAPALAQADVGIAIGSGTDIAAETADIILVESDPKDVASLILFGKATYKKMVQNLVYATAYNAIALPLAAGVLFWAGITISPAVGAALMSLSTIAVAANAQLLKRRLR